MKYDHYESKIDFPALALWTLVFILFAWGAWTEIRSMRIERRMADMEMYQGPQMPTEWTIVNGKISLYVNIPGNYVQVTP